MTKLSQSLRSFKAKFYKKVMPKIYGVGAAVVITGAMFKLLNWHGGHLMLGLGLTTEALIFILSSFETEEKEVDWTRAYPEILVSGNGNTEDLPSTSSLRLSDGAISEKLDAMFSKAKLDVALINRLRNGMEVLSNTAEHMVTITDATDTTKKYIQSMGSVTEILQTMCSNHEEILSATKKISEISNYAQDYHSHMRGITESLHALNTTYQGELEDCQQRAAATKSVHGHIATSIDQLQQTGYVADQFKTELESLSARVAELNGIYSKMLSALHK